MAYTFFGIYFEDVNNNEYRCGFYDNNNYQPIVEKRTPQGWQEINHRQGTGNANQICRLIRASLPHPIAFPNGHTQNERMELIHQMVYNIQRYTNERVNYRGAHR